MDVASTSCGALGAAGLHCGGLWARLNRVIAWESGEFGVSVKLHLIGDGDLARLLVDNGIYIEDRAVSGNAISARGPGYDGSTFFGRGCKDAFFPGDEDITMSTVTYVQVVREICGRTKGERCGKGVRDIPVGSPLAKVKKPSLRLKTATS